MTQPDLFTVPPSLPAYQRRSETSKAAAVKAVSFAASQRERLAAWLAQQGEGGTQIEAAAALGICRQSLCPRFRELETDGRIVKSPAIRGGARVYTTSTQRGTNG